MILRRLYLYVVSAAALVVVAAGLTLLGVTVLMFVFHDPNADQNRGQLAVATAMTVVAVPVWAIHFFFAQRFATRDPYERASALRHLYLYFVCLAGAIATTIVLFNAIRQLVEPVLDNYRFDGEGTAQLGWAALVLVAIWGFHFNVASRDRAAVHEEGASSTLRRWYVYPALLVGLLMMLTGASGVFETAWTALATTSRDYVPYYSGPLALFVAGGLLWGFHARTIALHHISEDRHSTLRALEGFIAVAVSMVIALLGASQILYYALARGLGVSNPSGASNDVLTAAAGPASQVAVYGVAWFLINRRLARDADMQEADRQAGVRRLYTNLACLVSLAAWAAGMGGVLWTAAEQVEAPIIGVATPDWKNQLSLWVTLLVVGLAVWLAHWRHAPWASDRQSLSRRLYVWAALLASVLAVLGGGVGMLNALLQQLFSAHPRLNDTSNLDFGHYLAVIVVAAGVAAYHFRVLRADAAARPPRPAAAAAPSVAPAPSEPSPAAAQMALHGHRYSLVVSDATEDDIHSALANLPPQASYELKAEAPDGVAAR